MGKLSKYTKITWKDGDRLKSMPIMPKGKQKRQRKTIMPLKLENKRKKRKERHVNRMKDLNHNQTRFGSPRVLGIVGNPFQLPLQHFILF